MVLNNGNIYTVNKSSPKVSAVAISGGKIIAIGSDLDLESFIGDNTIVFDLKGLTMVPGFIESHGHIMG